MKKLEEAEKNGATIERLMKENINIMDSVMSGYFVRNLAEELVHKQEELEQQGMGISDEEHKECTKFMLDLRDLVKCYTKGAYLSGEQASGLKRLTNNMIDGWNKQ